MSTRAKRTVEVENKPTFAQMVRDIMGNSADAMTKQEILSRIEWDNTGATVSVSEKLSNALRDQLRSGFAESETDALGVIRYRLTDKQPLPSPFQTPKKKLSQTKEAAQKRIARKEEAEMSHEAKAKSDINKIKEELGVMEIPHDYQEAYNRGFNDAMFHGHRDAYNAGRQSVLKGLLKLLNIKGEVML